MFSAVILRWCAIHLHVSFEVLMMYSQPSTKFQLVLSHHYFHGLVLTVASIPNLLHGCFYGHRDCTCLEYLYVYSTYKMCVAMSVYVYKYIWERSKEGKLLPQNTTQCWGTVSVKGWHRLSILGTCDPNESKALFKLQQSSPLSVWMMRQCFS